MSESKQEWIKQRGCINCLQEIMQGFLDSKEKTIEEVEKMMAKVPIFWEPMNGPEDSHRAGAEKCPKHNLEMFQFDRYVNT